MSIEQDTYKGFRSLAMSQDKKVSQIVEQFMISYIGEHGRKKQEAKYGCNHTTPTDRSQNNPGMTDYHDS